MPKRTIAALIVMTAAIPAAAAERLSAIDVAVDHAELTGRRLEITGCTLSAVMLDYAVCTLVTGNGSAGNVAVDPKTMERRLLKFALKNCAGFVPRPECRTDLRVTIATANNGEPLLTDVEWIETPPEN